MTAPEATEFSLYPIGVDWRKISLDVRKHANITKDGLLTFWEQQIATNIGNKKLDVAHVNKRLDFKYFVMGLNILLMFMVATNNYYIGFKILDELTLGELGLVAMYLPKDIRKLVAESTHFMSSIIKKTKLQLSYDRIAACLIRSKKSLYIEHLTVQPFFFESVVDSLDFTTANVSNIVFNPVYPILALLTTNDILFIYSYGKRKHRQILYHKSQIFGMFEISWSNNGLFLYTIFNDWGTSTACLATYTFNKKYYRITLSTEVIKIKRTKAYRSQLWLSNNEILILHPSNTENNFSKINLLDNPFKPIPLFNLNEFSNIKSLCCQQNKLYFVAECTNSVYKHSTIYEYDFIQQKVMQAIHCPGYIVSLNSNKTLLVFLYIWNNRLMPTEIATLQPFTNTQDCQPNCPFTSTFDKHRPLTQYLMVGIFDGDKLDIRKLDTT